MRTSLRSRWAYAAKPKSWPKLLVPFVLGQAIGLAGGSFDALALALSLAVVVFDLLFIVFLNDFGDRAIDTLKRRRYPNGSSAKTIPDGLLPARWLLAAGVLCGALALAAAALMTVLLDRTWAAPLTAVALAIFLAYTFPPLKLNYRGGGELLEMFGVGVVLPYLSAYFQSGRLSDVPGLWLLPGFALLSLSSAIASGLADERSDRAGGKRTVVALAGNRIGRRAVEVSYFAGACVWAVTGWLVAGLPTWLTAVPAMVVFFYGGVLLVRSRPARTDRPAALGRYKLALHHGIWRGGVAAAMLLLWWHLMLGDQGS